MWYSRRTASTAAGRHDASSAANRACSPCPPTGVPPADGRAAGWAGPAAGTGAGADALAGAGVLSAAGAGTPATAGAGRGAADEAGPEEVAGSEEVAGASASWAAGRAKGEVDPGSG